MKVKKIQFENRDGISLAASLTLPVSTSPITYALLAPCFTCHKDLKSFLYITQALVQQGIAVFRFDFTGLGQSGGAFMDTNFSSNVDDLLVASKFLKENYQAPQIIIGHSLGGSAVLLAATHLDDVKAVVTLGAPSEPAHVQRLFQESIEDINKEGKAIVSIGQRPFIIKKQFIDDLVQTDLARELKNLKKALLIMHSPQDTIVGIAHAARIYKLAIHPKSFISLEGADHFLTKKVDAMYVGSIIAIWASRYIIH